MENSLEQELIYRCKKKDADAFKRLMAFYKNRLFSYLLRSVKNKEVAEDLFQEVLIKVWKGIPKYKEENKFSSWIFSIAHNIIIDSQRKINLPHDDIENTERASNTDPHKEYLAVETESIINRALTKLSEKQKEVFLLRQHGEFSFKEIAEKTNQPLNTVLSHMHYAVKKLKTALKEEHADRK